MGGLKAKLKKMVQDKCLKRQHLVKIIEIQLSIGILVCQYFST